MHSLIRSKSAGGHLLIVRAHTAVAFLLLALACVSSPARAQDLPALRPGGLRLNDPASGVALRARAELGSIGVLSHRIQYGRAGNRVDYRDDADQDTLFFFARLSAEVELNARHTFVFLYQPLTLQTEAVLGRQLRVGEVVFPRETPVGTGLSPRDALDQSGAAAESGIRSAYQRPHRTTRTDQGRSQGRPCIGACRVGEHDEVV